MKSIKSNNKIIKNLIKLINRKMVQKLFENFLFIDGFLIKNPELLGFYIISIFQKRNI